MTLHELFIQTKCNKNKKERLKHLFKVLNTYLKACHYMGLKSQ